MRICFICKDFEKRNLNLQPWRYVFELCRGLSSKGFKIQIFTNTIFKASDYEIFKVMGVEKTINVIPKPFSRNKRLTELIRSAHPDVIFWSIGMTAFFYMRWIKGLKVPLVLILTDELMEAKSIFHVGFSYIIRDIKHTWIELLSVLFPRFVVPAIANSPLISKIVVLNDASRRRLIRMGVYESKISVIPTSFDPPLQPPCELKRKIRESLRINEGDFVTVYMGPPRKIRGPDIAVLASSFLARIGLPIRLLILSRTRNDDLFGLQEEAELATLAGRLGISHKVNIVQGFLDRQTLAAFMHIADLFVFPFRMIESEMPMAPLEAMSIGKPIVSTKLGSMEELLDEGRGVLVDPGNAEQLAEAIRLLYNRPDLRNMIGQRAKHYLARWPSWNDIVERMVIILNHIVESKNISTGGDFHTKNIPAFMCFIGLDGTGKTSHAKRLESKLKDRGIRCVYRWFGGPRFLTLAVFALSRFLGFTPVIDKSRGLRKHVFYRNKAIAHLVLWTQTLDTILYTLVEFYIPHWMGLKIIGDRFIHDVIVNLIADTRIPILQMKVGRILVGLIPRDCSVILLDAGNDVLTSRKRDIVSEEYLIERRRIYSELALSLKIPVVKSDSSFEKTQELIETKLLHHSISSQEEVLSNPKRRFLMHDK